MTADPPSTEMMMPALRADADEIRTLFSRAMSDMYRAEVPQYGTLVELVNDTNRETVRQHQQLRASLARSDELERLGVERHGAIRLGRADELRDMRRVFAVMGMHPVGYYDLSIAGVPVHATAFRPIDDAALRRNPFRVFTSLLRLDLIEDESLRAEAEQILGRRRIFTPRALELVGTFETTGHLTIAQADEFVREALETFRWHSEATVSLEVYSKLHATHRLIADVVSFRGPHINHLTPRTLDIDAVQAAMPRRGIAPKAIIEGPPRRDCPILLRQTSFKALEEPILFRQANETMAAGTHTARFGEIEQRGVALTPKGRELYDRLLASVRQAGAAGASARDYDSELAERFKMFPDDWSELRAQGLAFFRYSATSAGIDACKRHPPPSSLDDLLAAGFLRYDPIVYEDFLPVSAAGIFQSNLGTDQQQNYAARSNRAAFEVALGAGVHDEMKLYAQAERTSLEQAVRQLGSPHLACRAMA
ncbi:VOC family protein [Bradyrhizobium sp. CCGUVB4N]|nr:MULTISPECIES: VOC family protein [unclassified Bradyrhizobium]MCP3379886.1 VOC family protein [Bradyrhizobium sp. CCGUVB4N]MCP3440719.1 VOC family protein [Bradyrhizobium sp. CCGUVB14]